jgi:hypothetical protein
MKGQLELSFGMIFSLIIILATIGTAAYFIISFVKTGSCADLQLSYASLQDSIDDVWGAALGEKTVDLRMPRGVTSLCFGDARATGNATFRELIDPYLIEGYGLYALPPTKACDGELASKQLTKVTGDFFCVPVRNNKVTIRASKASVGERMVTLHA